MHQPLLPSEQLTHSTVRISSEMTDGSISTGTGFFYAFARNKDKFIPAIVTNKHVVANASIGRFNLTIRSSDNLPMIGQHITIELDEFESRWIPHPDPSVDLCAMPIAPLLTKASEAGTDFFFITLDEALLPTASDLTSLAALEEIVMIGYPNGIWDAANNMPILRKGITATHPNMNYEGKKEFLIDAACFPGSSGSPVFLYNANGWTDRNGNTHMGSLRVKLLGLLYAGPQHTTEGEIKIINVPTQQKAVAVSTIPNNLGLVIKAERLRELDDIISSNA